MSFQKHFILFGIFTLFTFAGCNSATNTPTNTATTTNANSTDANAVRANADNPFNTTKKAEEATTNKAETVAPVVAAYYQALRKKDDAALRKIYSRETLQSLEADMKEEGAKSLAAFITELEPVPDQPFEVRNEEDKGDTAIAELRGGAYPNGIKIKFVKENGEWKMTNESPEFQSVKQTGNNSPK
jgi:hypothetical protein